MSIAFHNLLSPSPLRINLHPRTLTPFPLFTSRHLSFAFSNSEFSNFNDRNSLNFNSLHPIKAYDSDSSISTSPEQNPSFDDFNLDSFLAVAEFLCIVSSAAIFAVLGWKSLVLGGIWRGFMTYGALGLVGGVAIGTWIRRRQWRRSKGVSGGKMVNFFERIEKLEEDLRSSAIIIRVLSRQLEKLGIRFRVTRKALKGPIAAAAALAQKNSEATRVLAAQEDILEKELREIQKVLLAMQEQQQKQLELILAIGKSAKVFDDKQECVQEKDKAEAFNLTDEREVEIHQAQPLSISNGSSNNRV